VLVSSLHAWWTTGPYTEHEDLTARAIDIAEQRWPGMAAELEANRDQIVQGSHDEDFGSDTLYGNASDYSAYSPTVPDAWWPTAQLHLNVLQWNRAGQNPWSWNVALSLHGTDMPLAWLALGHVIHNLEDLYVPAHPFFGPHGLGTSGLVENHSWPLFFDNFEQYSEVTADELSRADVNRIPVDVPTPESLMILAARFSTSDQESLGFFPSRYYAPPESAGDWGRYRPFPYEDHPSGKDEVDNDVANAWSRFLVPRCVEQVAGLIRLFYTLTPHDVILPASITVRPSPFRGSATVRYVLSMPCPVSVTITDRSGRLLRSLFNGLQSAGVHEIVWDGCDQQGRSQPAGTCFCILRYGKASKVRPFLKLP
jgi:hypothetical protein